MTKPQTRPPAEIVVYCADCDKDWDESEKSILVYESIVKITHTTLLR